jgi:hypothetical protein
MNESYFEEFEEIFSNEKFKIEGNVSQRTIYSYLGSLNESIAIDKLECLLLKEFYSLKKMIFSRFKIGKLSLNEAIETIEEYKGKLSNLILSYNPNISEREINFSLNEAKFDSEVKGININTFPKKVKDTLWEKLKDYSIDTSTICSLEFERLQKLKVFSLNSKISNFQLCELFEELSKAKIISGTQQDFVDIFRGKGESYQVINIEKESHFRTLIKLFQNNGYVENQTMIIWVYLVDHVLMKSGKKFNRKNLISNTGKSLNKEVVSIFNKIL